MQIVYPTSHIRTYMYIHIYMRTYVRMPIYRTHGNFKTITLQIILLQNLDLTAANRKLIHEGPLTWRIQHIKKTVGVCVCVCVCMCACVCVCAIATYIAMVQL